MTSTSLGWLGNPFIILTRTRLRQQISKSPGTGGVTRKKNDIIDNLFLTIKQFTCSLWKMVKHCLPIFLFEQLAMKYIQFVLDTTSLHKRKLNSTLKFFSELTI